MSQKTDFIRSVQAGAVLGWKVYKVLPSLIVAQAILESEWGKSDLAVKANNFFSIKADASWKGQTIVLQTKEYLNSQWVAANATWRKYISIEASIEDHSKFYADNEKYKLVIGETDYKKAVTAIYNAGYTTDPNYVNLIVSVIEDNKLDIIDKEVFANPDIQISIPVTKRIYVLPAGTFKVGSEGGTDVKTIQAALNKLGFNCGNADGVFSSRTADALKRFQSVYTNPPTGIYDEKTRQAMLLQLNK